MSRIWVNYRSERETVDRESAPRVGKVGKERVKRTYHGEEEESLARRETAV